MVYQYGPLVKRSKTLASHASNMGSNPVRVTKRRVGEHHTATLVVVGPALLALVSR